MRKTSLMREYLAACAGALLAGIAAANAAPATKTALAAPKAPAAAAAPCHTSGS
jgi:hypothetical protein